MPTLVLSPRYTPDSQALWNAALQAGWSVERLHSHHPPAWLRDKDPAIYGEALFANIVADELSLALLEPPFDWLARLPEKYLQRNIEYMTLGEARKRSERAFVKPAYDKSFDAAVYDSGVALPVGEVFPDAMPVLVAEPVVWGIEFRCFVLDGKIASLSPYSRNGELVQDEDGRWRASDDESDGAFAFVDRVLNDRHVDLPPAFVMDVGTIEGRGWGLVEANPAWASGIYGCDAAAVLPVLKRACVRQEDLAAEDRRWVNERLV